MSSHKRLPRAQRREQIIHIATDVFARHGYHDSSMDDVAEAAGVSKPVLYQHFESKSELFSTVMDKSIGDLAERLSAILDSVDNRYERVYTAFNVYFQYVANNRSSFTVLTRCSNETLESRLKWTEAVERYVTILTDSIRERNYMSHMQAYVAARAIVGLAAQVAHVCLDFDSIEVDEVSRMTAKLAYEGLSSIQPGDFTFA